MESKYYAGKILRVDLSRRETAQLETADYADKFVGGKGLAARLYWEYAGPQARAGDPSNCLVFANGPLSGFTGLASSRWVVCGTTAAHQPECFSYGNLGGGWGNILKASGFDAVVVQGRSDSPVYLFLHDSKGEIRDASALRGKTTFETSDSLKADLGKNTGVVCVGPAGENGVPFATILADQGASCGGGMGYSLGVKNLKAIAVAGSWRPEAADPAGLQLVKEQVKLIKGSALEVPSPWRVAGVTTNEICHSCGIGCSRQGYTDRSGHRFKSFCAATGVYSRVAADYYGGWHEVQLEAIRLCDGYGLDTAVVGPMISWLIACYRQGIISEGQSGLPLSRAGSPEFIRDFARKVALKEGFGQVLAQGTLKAADLLGSEARALLADFVSTPTSENKDYDPRLILTTGLILATEPRKPIQQLHGIAGNILIIWSNWARGLKDSYFNTENLRQAARRFWGGEEAVDYSTYAGKALAAKLVQDRALAQECLVLCDLHWPMLAAYSGQQYVGDPSVESKILSAVTGKKIGEAELLELGERLCNLQRAILLRQGWGGRSGDILLDYFFERPLKQGEIFFDPDGLMPGKGAEIISRVGKVLDREAFEGMKSEYYALRGWGVRSGYPTGARLTGLGLADVASDLESKGLLG
jgi:aldehyde:ferredoxin oxidoreductase